MFKSTILAALAAAALLSACAVDATPPDTNETDQGGGNGQTEPAPSATPALRFRSDDVALSDHEGVGHVPRDLPRPSPELDPTGEGPKEMKSLCSGEPCSGGCYCDHGACVPLPGSDRCSIGGTL
ncbi:MAG TPA: hypothetical protein VMI75_01350 [Polyangiaceae bacterium]|nr:hypothetical protein [Polyangiaceae bacterium]